MNLVEEKRKIRNNLVLVSECLYRIENYIYADLKDHAVKDIKLAEKALHEARLDVVFMGEEEAK